MGLDLGADDYVSETELQRQKVELRDTASAPPCPFLLRRGLSRGAE